MKFKFDDRKLKNELQKRIEEIAYSKIVEETRKEGNMFILQRLEEEVLSIILQKYDENEQFTVSGDYSEFPSSMRFSIGDSLNKLKIAGYLSTVNNSLSGWSVILSPDGLNYFEKKGLRKELFEELPDNAKELLRKLLEVESNNGKLDEILNEEIKNDKTDKIVRGIIGTLKYNGLLNVSWGSGIVSYAELTNEGRNYFEREKKYMEQMEKNNRPFINIQSLENSGFLNMGSITDSNITINNSIEQVKSDIEKNGENDKEELFQLLEEVKDYIDNLKDTKSIAKNTGLFKRIGQHFEKHQWFYSEIVALLGQAILLLMGKQI